MRRLHWSVGVTVLCLAILCSTAGSSVHAQTVHYGVVADDVRALLERAWSAKPGRVTRAYCVRRARFSTRRVSPGAIDTIIQILAVRPPDVRDADPDHVDFVCPPGTPELHTHTPAACPSNAPHWCVTGGASTYSCQPSRDDYEELIERGDPFGIVQCDRRTFRFYYPSDFVRANPAPPAAPPKSRGDGVAPRPLRRAGVRPR